MLISLGQLLLYINTFSNVTHLMSAISEHRALMASTDVLKWVLDFTGCVCTRCTRRVKTQRAKSDQREGGGEQRVQRDLIQNAEIITARTSIKVFFLTHYCCWGVARMLLSVSPLPFLLSASVTSCQS